MVRLSTSPSFPFSSEKWVYKCVTCRKSFCKTEPCCHINSEQLFGVITPFLCCLLRCTYVEEQSLWLWVWRVWSSAIIWLDEVQHVQIVLNSAHWVQCTCYNSAQLFRGHVSTAPVFREDNASPEHRVWKAACAWNGRRGWQAKESSNFPLRCRFKWMVRAPTYI